ncbi:hypothetical protein WH96_20615 [Kiloniella spongiae]|uniref:General secretion pathway protein F n=1 Tax=Kiloniella spongiae TaxID=1489064 RepID=A0A0H2MDX7_9PROT|nr:type II secretion system F family protein [Kiloniella spongiae]KLN58887.1 hypothetical protein WH96_20615 [Kiloniella spongiae]
MARYSYKAVNASGHVVEGIKSASSRDSLFDSLKQDGFLPISAEEAKAGLSAGGNLSLSFGKSGLKPADIVVFTRDIATLLDTGLSLDRALTLIAKLNHKPLLQAMTQRILARVQKGLSFAEALQAEGDIFPGQYIGLVKAGETSGKLDGILVKLASHMEKSQELRERVNTALQYPVLVICVAMVTLMILMTVVIPQFQPIFEEAGNQLPLVTRGVIGLSVFLQNYWWAIPLSIGGLILCFVLDYNRPEGKKRWHGVALRMPILGNLLRRADTARFCRVLGTLLTNGLSALDAFDLSLQTVSNQTLHEAIGKVRKQLERGEGFSAPLRETCALPELASHLIGVGEESGNLQRMLLKIAEIFEGEVRRDLEQRIKMLVPVITIFLGVLVAVIIGSILSAILSVYNLPI